MTNGIESILPGTEYEKHELIDKLVGYIEAKINDKRELISALQEKINGNFGSKEFEALFNLSFKSFTKEFFGKLIMEIQNHIDQITDMSQFSQEETILFQKRKEKILFF